MGTLRAFCADPFMAPMTRARAGSPARSLPREWREPVCSPLTLGQLQVDHAWTLREHDELVKLSRTLQARVEELEKESSDRHAENVALTRERDALAHEREVTSGILAALKYTLGLIHTMITQDVAVCQAILDRLTGGTGDRHVVILGVAWAAFHAIVIGLLQL